MSQETHALECKHCHHPAHCGHSCMDESCDHCTECGCDRCEAESKSEEQYNINRGYN